MDNETCTEYYMNIRELLVLFSSFTSLTFYSVYVPESVIKHASHHFKTTILLWNSFSQMVTSQNHYITWTPYSKCKDIIIVLPNTILENTSDVLGYNLIFYHCKCNELKYMNYVEYILLDNLYVYVSRYFVPVFQFIFSRFVNQRKENIVTCK